MPTFLYGLSNTNCIDTYISQSNSNSNYGTGNYTYIQQSTIGTVRRTLMKVDLSGLPDQEFTEAKLVLGGWIAAGEWADLFRLKRPWVETQATWNNYATGSAWSSPGGFDVNDCEQVAISSRQSLVGESSGRKYWSPPC